jgi:hypothetical protein
MNIIGTSMVYFIAFLLVLQLLTSPALAQGPVASGTGPTHFPTPAPTTPRPSQRPINSGTGPTPFQHHLHRHLLLKLQPRHLEGHSPVGQDQLSSQNLQQHGLLKLHTCHLEGQSAVGQDQLPSQQLQQHLRLKLHPCHLEGQSTVGQDQLLSQQLQQQLRHHLLLDLQHRFQHLHFSHLFHRVSGSSVDQISMVH